MSALSHGALCGAVLLAVMLTTVALGIWFERKFAGRM